MITTEMVKYWISHNRSSIAADYKDIANGKYEPGRLRLDILETWRTREDKG
jgi:hypothetical protein